MLWWAIFWLNIITHKSQGGQSVRKQSILFVIVPSFRDYQCFLSSQDLSWTLGAKAQQKRKKHVKNSPILRRHFHEIKSSHHYYFWSVAFSLSAVAIGWRIISWQKSWAEGRFNITGWLFHKLGKGAEWSTEAETDLLSTRTALSPRLSTGISHRRARSLSSISVVKELKESEQKKQEWQ